MRFHTAALRLQGALERRYRPDQPRAPGGSPIGGQWIDAGAPLPRRRVASEMTLFGRLSKQYRHGRTLLCVCDFGGQSWIFTYEKEGASGCYNIVHQSSALALGTRLNDN